MIIKPSVDLLGLKPEILVGLQVAASVYTEHGWSLRLTSGVEGVHDPPSGRPSLHHAGYAVDIGFPPPGSDRASVLEELKTALSEQFDALFEVDHFHIEWQPKK